MKKRGQPKKALNLKKAPISLKIQKWIIDFLDKQDKSRAVLIEEAIIQKHKLKKPPPNGDLFEEV